MRGFEFAGAGFAMAAALAVAPAAAATIDFTTMSPGTAIADQFAGVGFTLIGSETPGAPIVARAFGGNVLPTLGNAVTDSVPTGTAIAIRFAPGASGISFTFDNYGVNLSRPSNWVAYDAAQGVMSSGLLDVVTGLELVTVEGSGIASLVISNGSDGTYDWRYGIGRLDYTLGASPAPEPAVWMLTIIGIGAAGGAMRRRGRVPATA